jgi:hypothetical protein
MKHFNQNGSVVSEQKCNAGHEYELVYLHFYYTILCMGVQMILTNPSKEALLAVSNLICNSHF